jgi:Glycosyltransferase family 87
MLESDTTHLAHPGHDSERPIARRLKLLLVVFLAALSIAYLAKGFYYGIFLNGEGSDVLRRWLEERFVLGEHIDPQVAASFARRGVVYPPWSYLAGLLMFWPPWPQVRVWFALINLVSLIWIVSFVAAYASDQSKLDRILLVLSVTAIGATCTTIGVGNYPVIVVALLVGAYQAEQADRPILSGLLMGLALLKPQLAGPFLLVALVRGRFRTLIAAVIYVIAATIAVWVISGIDPVRMLGQSLRMTEVYASTTAGLLTLVLDLGVAYRLAATVTAIVCLAIFTPMLWYYRDRSLMLLFAIAAVTSRLWTYNLNTSNLMLIFLLLALWRLAIETRDMRAIALFLAVGVSLWVPAGFSEHHAVQLAEHLIWLAGVIGLLTLDRHLYVSNALATPLAGTASRRWRDNMKEESMR